MGRDPWIEFSTPRRGERNQRNVPRGDDKRVACGAAVLWRRAAFFLPTKGRRSPQKTRGPALQKQRGQQMSSDHCGAAASVPGHAPIVKPLHFSASRCFGPDSH